MNRLGPVFVEIVVVDIILYDKCIDHAHADADAHADSSESTCRTGGGDIIN